MVQPLVSVVIPAYNSGEQIRATIQSALSQTYPHVEVLVVDDNSTDATWQILQEFKDSVRLIRNERNLGISGSRNAALKASHGEYIALLDHDDLWDPQKLAKQMGLFEKNPGLGLVFSDAFCIKDDRQKWRYFQLYPAHRGRAFQALMRQDFISCPTILFRKSLLDQLGDFRQDFRTAEEYELCLRIAREFPIDYVDEPLATYRIHGSNFSNDVLTALERIKILEIYAPQMPLHGKRAVGHLFASRLYLRQGEIAPAIGQLWKGFMLMVRRPARFPPALLEFFQMKRSQKKRLLELFGKW